VPWLVTLIAWLVTLIALVLLAGCGGSDVRLSTPAVAVDEPPQIRVEGLDAGRRVELRAAWRAHDGTRSTSTTDLRADGIAGLSSPPSARAGPPVLALGGSEGGHYGVATAAAALAAGGHPVLALGYVGEPGLRKRLLRVPVETVAEGASRLREASGRRDLVLMGASRGGELALLAASLAPALAEGVIALVPGSRVGFSEPGRGPAWTWEGQPLAPREPIAVDRIPGRVLAVGAGQDTAWLSGAYVDEIAERDRVEPVQYEEAGHAIGVPLPYLPATPTILTGGTPEADERARRDLWPRILDFLG